MEKNFYNLGAFTNIPSERLTSFRAIFSFIKKKLQIKNMRKSQIDSILKKCKGKILKQSTNVFKNVFQLM